MNNASSFKLIISHFLITLSLIIPSTSIQTIQLPLNVHNDFRLTTFIQVGNIQQQMDIDITSSVSKICCKRQNSIFQKVYYFLFNPFFQIYDYSCKVTDDENKIKDSAKIANLGYIQMQFQQLQFPSCQKGIMGLDKNSTFLTVLPNNLKIFTISRNRAQYKKYLITFGQQSKIIKQYNYFPVLSNTLSWTVHAQTVKFNQILMGSYAFILNSKQSYIRLPIQLYYLVEKELVNSFQCKQIDKEIYCPCETGDTSNYPVFEIILNKNSSELSYSNKFNIQIKPSSYLLQDSQTCRVLFKPTVQSSHIIQVNILFLKNLTIKFNPLQKKIGFLTIQNSGITNNDQKIKLPLQLILNCLVILLLCVFLALVMIEIIKRISGLSEIKEEVFRMDIRDRDQYHYANQ